MVRNEELKHLEASNIDFGCMSGIEYCSHLGAVYRCADNNFYLEDPQTVVVNCPRSEIFYAGDDEQTTGIFYCQEGAMHKHNSGSCTDGETFQTYTNSEFTCNDNMLYLSKLGNITNCSAHNRYHHDHSGFEDIFGALKFVRTSLKCVNGEIKDQNPSASTPTCDNGFVLISKSSGHYDCRDGQFKQFKYIPVDNSDSTVETLASTDASTSKSTAGIITADAVTDSASTSGSSITEIVTDAYNSTKGTVAGYAVGMVLSMLASITALGVSITWLRRSVSEECPHMHGYKRVSNVCYNNDVYYNNVEERVSPLALQSRVSLVSNTNGDTVENQSAAHYTSKEHDTSIGVAM